MSDRMYLYEESPGAAWQIADRCAPQNAELACAVAAWAGLRSDPEDVRWMPLPGGERLYFVGSRILVSTVPLPWLPESSRRGVATLGGAK